MKQLDDHLYIIYSLDDVSLLTSIDSLRYRNMLLVIPGMLDTDVSDSIYVDIAKVALILVDSSKWNVIILHNQSHGFISDLGECIIGKLLGGIGRLIEDPPEYPGRVLKHILEHRPSSQETVIFCHSQGGIITTNALNCCNSYLRSTIKIRFFGSASWSYPKVSKDNVISFTNDLDIVSYLFGRGLCKNTIRPSFRGHLVKEYRPVMELALQEVFGLLSESELKEKLTHVSS